MNDYEAKQEARRERYEAASAKAAGAMEAAQNASRAATAGIPLGQPILVGHHSEGRHRNAIKRSDNAMRRAAEECEKAQHYSQKAEAVGRGGISADDPDAVVKLREKLAGMVADRTMMRDVNKAYRKEGKPEPDDAAGWKRIADRLGRDMQQIDRLREGMRTAYSWEKAGPFKPYQITNLGANIRRVEKRIEELRATEGAESCEHEAEGVTYRENVDANRVQVEFPGKPSAEIRKLLKTHGFRWAPTVGVWQRQLNNAGRYNMAEVERLSRLVGGEVKS